MAFHLTDDEAWSDITTAHTGFFATLRRDGSPIVLPIWHVVVDRTIYFRTPRSAQKLVRIGRDPRGSFLVESGRAWGELRYVVLPVRAVVVPTSEARTARERLLEKYAEHFAPAGWIVPEAWADYSDLVHVRLDPVGPLVTRNNAFLVRDPSVDSTDGDDE
jgi:hypothetical protein